MTLRLLFHTRCLASVALVVLIAGCVTEPPEEPWQDVSSFAWPTDLGTTMRYKLVSKTFEDDTAATAVIRPGAKEPDGHPWHRISQTSTVSPLEGAPDLQFHFRATRDTLFTENGYRLEHGLKATYALVAPLERGSSWIASHDRSKNDSVRATIIERYSYWKLEGVGYENVLAVKYEYLNQPRRQEWIRFYAQGVGVVLTIMNVYPEVVNGTFAPPEEYDRARLIETTAR
ncbi:MAG: hypothetical protein H7X80_04915 [bacterium]|nr:hypothetical protein [Candidatus Kapabacteria bacterium]